MPFSITTRLLGFVSGDLALALAAAVVFGWIQTDRLKSAKETIVALDGKAALLVQRITSDRQLIETRDKLITAQNNAVLAMQKAAEADRKAYMARIAAADKVAKVYEAQAADILSRQIETTDELERSRAALALIQEMVGAPKE